MRTVKMASIIGKSFNRTAEILFKPFSVKKWLKLLLIAFLAGALAGGGGLGGGNNQSVQKQKETIKAAKTEPAQISQSAAAREPSGVAGKTPSPRPPITMIAVIAGTILGLLLFFILLMTWLGSRFRFVWLNAIANNTASITEPYYRHGTEANSLFKFSLSLLFSYLFFLALDIGWAIFNMYASGAFTKGFIWTLPVGLNIFLLPAILAATVTIGIVILSVILDNFVVPMMALDGTGVIAALKKFGGIFKANRRDIIAFLLILLALGIVLGAGQTAVIFLALLVFVLIALIVFGIPFIFIALIMKAKIAFIIYAIVSAIPFGIAAVIVIVAAGLPFAVFFRALSIYYLISLNSGYTEASLGAYAARKAQRVKGKAPIILAITALFIIGLVVLMGLLAAIAIPNIIKARENAIKKKEAISAQAFRNPGSQRRAMFDMGEFEPAP